MRIERAGARDARRRDGGQSLVEFAIIVPILLALVVGIFEFGRAWNVYQVITNAAREGVRMVVVPHHSEAEARQAMQDALRRAALDPSAGSITITGVGDGISTPATVQIQYPYTFQFIGPIMGFLGDGGGSDPGTITLSSTIVMRNEY